MDNIGIKIQLATIPEIPGVYQFYDSDEKSYLCWQSQKFKKES